jgi:transcriptional regulator NrdR family protein
MFCECGDKRSAVINTLKIEKGVRRQRRCTGCNKSFYTLEALYLKPVTEKIKPDSRGIYTPNDAAKIKKAKVEVRRRIEDRVPSYFIEDDY